MVKVGLRPPEASTQGLGDGDACSSGAVWVGPSTTGVSVTGSGDAASVGDASGGASVAVAVGVVGSSAMVTDNPTDAVCPPFPTA